MERVTLYRGDNGTAQEFYEDESRRVCILRNHWENHWWAMVDGHVEGDEQGSFGSFDWRFHVVTAPNAEGVMRALNERRGIAFDVRSDREWRYVKPTHKNMRLVEVGAL